MNIDTIDSIIYFVLAIVIFTIAFGSIGLLYGTLVGIFLAFVRYNHY